jgi:toxin ParE1/3/4
MNRKIEFSKLSESDLRDIADYTIAKWGDAQFIAYQKKLENALVFIVDYPESGRELPHTKYRLVNAGNHVIIYRIFKEYIYILRILNQRMNILQHLIH